MVGGFWHGFGVPPEARFNLLLFFPPAAPDTCTPPSSVPSCTQLHGVGAIPSKDAVAVRSKHCMSELEPPHMDARLREPPCWPYACCNPKLTAAASCCPGPLRAGIASDVQTQELPCIWSLAGSPRVDVEAVDSERDHVQVCISQGSAGWRAGPGTDAGSVGGRRSGSRAC